MALNMPSKFTFLKSRTNLLLISVQQESPVAKSVSQSIGKRSVMQFVNDAASGIVCMPLPDVEGEKINNFHSHTADDTKNHLTPLDAEAICALS